MLGLFPWIISTRPHLSKSRRVFFGADAGAADQEGAGAEGAHWKLWKGHGSGSPSARQFPQKDPLGHCKRRFYGLTSVWFETLETQDGKAKRCCLFGFFAQIPDVKPGKRGRLESMEGNRLIWDESRYIRWQGFQPHITRLCSIYPCVYVLACRGWFF